LSFDLASEEGETWLYKEGKFGDTWYLTLLDKDDTVTVGNGTFVDCYCYWFDIPQMADDERMVWFAPVLASLRILPRWNSRPQGVPDSKNRWCGSLFEHNRS